MKVVLTRWSDKYFLLKSQKRGKLRFATLFLYILGEEKLLFCL